MGHLFLKLSCFYVMMALAFATTEGIKYKAPDCHSPRLSSACLQLVNNTYLVNVGQKETGYSFAYDNSWEMYIPHDDESDRTREYHIYFPQREDAKSFAIANSKNEIVVEWTDTEFITFAQDDEVSFKFENGVVGDFVVATITIPNGANERTYYYTNGDASVGGDIKLVNEPGPGRIGCSKECGHNDAGCKLGCSCADTTNDCHDWCVDPDADFSDYSAMEEDYSDPEMELLATNTESCLLGCTSRKICSAASHSTSSTVTSTTTPSITPSTTSSITATPSASTSKDPCPPCYFPSVGPCQYADRVCYPRYVEFVNNTKACSVVTRDCGGADHGDWQESLSLSSQLSSLPSDALNKMFQIAEKKNPMVAFKTLAMDAKAYHRVAEREAKRVEKMKARDARHEANRIARHTNTKERAFQNLVNKANDQALKKANDQVLSYMKETAQDAANSMGVEASSLMASNNQMHTLVYSASTHKKAGGKRGGKRVGKRAGKNVVRMVVM